MEKDSLSFDRRGAIKKCASITGIPFIGAISLSAVLTSCEKDTLKNTDKSASFDITGTEIVNIGGALKKTLGDNNNGKPLLIIRASQTEFIALTTVCTHQGCEVDIPKTPGGNIICPCHGSVYSQLTGAVINGPATASLRKFRTEFDGVKTLKIFF